MPVTVLSNLQIKIHSILTYGTEFLSVSVSDMSPCSHMGPPAAHCGFWNSTIKEEFSRAYTGHLNSLRLRLCLCLSYCLLVANPPFCTCERWHQTAQISFLLLRCFPLNSENRRHYREMWRQRKSKKGLSYSIQVSSLRSVPMLAFYFGRPRPGSYCIPRTASSRPRHWPLLKGLSPSRWEYSPKMSPWKFQPHFPC